MPAQMLIDSMEKLIALHQELQQTALQKTEAIKNNDIKLLTSLLREEQKHVASIQVVDNKRQTSVSLLSKGSETTVSEIIEKLPDSEQEILTELQLKLSQLLDELKSTNELNQQLLQYSLQLIHLNLDILAPEPELPNYSKAHDQPMEQPSGRSVFDSKA